MRQREKSEKSRVKISRPVSSKSPKSDASGRRQLEKRLAEVLSQLQTRDLELAVAREQQTAASEADHERWALTAEDWRRLSS